MNLFQYGAITLSSGKSSSYRIECDALTRADAKTLAWMAFHLLLPQRFGGVVGVPEGGLVFESLLRAYASPPGPWLVVDDVLTTGESMEEMKKTLDTANGEIMGVVMFARGPLPPWVKAVCPLPKELWDL